MPKEHKSWFDLIVYVFSFLFSRRKEKEEKEKERLKEVYKDLNNEYNRIDSNKEKQQNDIKTLDDVKDRLNHRF